jgi:hypothetical protein
MATHSSDILRGALDAEDAPVQVVRLTRTGDLGQAAVLPSSEVRALWNDPILKYSNVFDALFHEGAVVCEGDADCRFYATMLDEVEKGLRGSDLLFTHTAGKSRLFKVARALRAVQVPTRVITDFDVLQDAQDLENIVTALGGEWAAIEDDHQFVKTYIDALAGEVPDRSKVLEQITKILTDVPEGTLSTSTIDRIKREVKAPTGWKMAQKVGESVLTDPAAKTKFEHLKLTVAGIGLYIVPVGTLESFIPSVGGHGPRWLANVIEAGAHRDSAATFAARDFMTEVVSGL